MSAATERGALAALVTDDARLAHHAEGALDSAAAVTQGPSGRTAMTMGATTTAAMATKVSAQSVSVTPMSAM